MPDEQAISRREMLIKASAAVAGATLLPSSLFAKLLSLEEGEQVIPWSDPPPAPPRSRYESPELGTARLLDHSSRQILPSESLWHA